MQAQINKKTSGHDLTVFQTISEFVCDLQECFGTGKHQHVHALNLYHRLISKMSFRDDELILRHLEIFKNFCVQNRNQIRERSRQFQQSRIEFSDRIYIDMGYFFKLSDEESENAIWEYLLTISAYTDPANKTKDLLKQLKQDPSEEGNFLANILETVSSQLPSGSEGGGNPMDMFGNIMNSGLLSGLLGGLGQGQDGKGLDMGKLMNTMSGLMGTIKGEIEKSDDPLLKQLSGLMQLPMDTSAVGKEADTSAVEVDTSAVGEEAVGGK